MYLYLGDSVVQVYWYLGGVSIQEIMIYKCIDIQVVLVFRINTSIIMGIDIQLIF